MNNEMNEFEKVLYDYVDKMKISDGDKNAFVDGANWARRYTQDELLEEN